MSDSMAVPPSQDSGLFGVDLEMDRNSVIIIGVPWEATASYGRGTSQTPQALIPASHQLDFFDLRLGREFGDAVGMLPINEEWAQWNESSRVLADEVRQKGLDEKTRALHIAEVNRVSQALNEAVYTQTRDLLRKGKKVGVLGGDHSTPLGAMLAIYEKWPDMGVLHIDAHHDLRKAYEGFVYSHASIMYNLLNQVGDMALVSVGIRDFCQEEYLYARGHEKVTTWYDAHLQKSLSRGTNWEHMCRQIVDGLPEQVYISMDIDGLDPALCPHTGTPVPGGLNFGQANCLLEWVVETGREVVGFDLCEVAPHKTDPENEWDLNVGARMLHKLCSLTET